MLFFDEPLSSCKLSLSVMKDTVSVIHVPAQIVGRCLVRKPQGEGPAPLLLGFHGYGENAERFLKSMASIPGAQSWLIASVQALHPFYRRSSGEVVASWMTRLDREMAIESNVEYVSRVLGRLRKANELDDEVVVMCGFSQGVAMAYRAAAHHPGLHPSLLVLAGDIPPELTGRQLSHFRSVLIGRGSEDQWYGRDQLQTDVGRLRDAGVETSVAEFPGGHEWGAEFYVAAAEFLKSLLSGLRQHSKRSVGGEVDHVGHQQHESGQG